jgi:integrase/recombinase XerD
MSALAKAVAEYIRLRRALGLQLRHAGRELPKFVDFLDREARSFTHSDRLGLVRGFARWHSATDPRTEIPIAKLLPRRYQRPTPYFYTDEQVEQIVSCARSLPSARGLRGLTFSTLYGLLAVTGMRVGEAVALDWKDVDLAAGILSVRQGKFGKSRFIPVHETTCGILRDYARQRVALLPAPRTAAFFVSERGRRVSTGSARSNFIVVSREIGLRPYTPENRRSRGPRLHDLRHRFAIQTLINWYRSGADVDREIPKLATYLGHHHPFSVYW